MGVPKGEVSWVIICADLDDILEPESHSYITITYERDCFEILSLLKSLAPCKDSISSLSLVWLLGSKLITQTVQHCNSCVMWGPKKKQARSQF